MLSSLQGTIKVVGTVLLFLALERACAWSGSLFHADGMTGGSASICAGSNYHIAPDNPGFEPIFLAEDEPPWWGPPPMHPLEEEYYHRYRRPPPPLSAMWEQTSHNLDLGPPPPFPHHLDPFHPQFHHHLDEEMEYRRRFGHPLEQGGSYVSRLVSGRTVIDVTDAVVVDSSTKTSNSYEAKPSTYASVGSQTQPEAYRKDPPRVQTSTTSRGTSGDPASSVSVSVAYDNNSKQRAFAAYDMRQKAAADFDRNRQNRELDADEERRQRRAERSEKTKLKEKRSADRRERRSDGGGSKLSAIKDKLKSKLSDSKVVVKGGWKSLAVAFKGGAVGLTHQIKSLASHVKSTDRTWGDMDDDDERIGMSNDVGAPSEPPSLSQAYSIYGNKAAIAPSPAVSTERPSPSRTASTTSGEKPSRASRSADSKSVSNNSPTSVATASQSMKSVSASTSSPSSSSSGSSQPSLSRAYSAKVGSARTSDSSTVASGLSSSTTLGASPLSASSWGTSTAPAPSPASDKTSSSHSALGSSTKPKSPEKYNPFNPWNPQGSGTSSSTSAGSAASASAATSGSSDSSKSSYSSSSTTASASTSSSPPASSSSQQASSYSAFGSSKPKAPEASNPFSPWNPPGGSSSSNSATSSSGAGSSPSRSSSSPTASAATPNEKASYSAVGNSKPKAPEKYNPFNPWNPQGSSASTSTDNSSSGSRSSDSLSSKQTSYSTDSRESSSSSQQKASYSAFGGGSKPQAPETSNPFSPWNPTTSTSTAASASAGTNERESSSRSASPSTRSESRSTVSGSSTSGASYPAGEKKSQSEFDNSKPQASEKQNPFAPWSPPGSTASSSSAGSQKSSFSAFGNTKPQAPQRSDPFSPWNPQQTTSDSANAGSTSSSEQSQPRRESYSAFGDKPKSPESPNPFSPWNPQSASTSTSTSSSDTYRNSPDPEGSGRSGDYDASPPSSAPKNSWSSFGSKPKAPPSNHELGGWNAAHSASSAPSPSAFRDYRYDDATNSLGSVRNTPTQLGASRGPPASKSYSGFGSKPRAPASSHSLGGWVDQSATRWQGTGAGSGERNAPSPADSPAFSSSVPQNARVGAATGASSSSRTGENAGLKGVGGADTTFLPSETLPPKTFSVQEGVIPPPDYDVRGGYSPQMASSSSDRLERGSFDIGHRESSDLGGSRHFERQGEPPSLAKTFVNYDNKPRDMNSRHLLDGEPPSLAKSYALDNRPRPAVAHYDARETAMHYVPSPAMVYGSSSSQYSTPAPTRNLYGTFDSMAATPEIAPPIGGNMGGSSNVPSWVQGGVKSPTFYTSTPTPASAHSEEQTAASPSSFYASSAPPTFSGPPSSSFGSAPPIRADASRVDAGFSSQTSSSHPSWSNEGSSNDSVPAWVKGGVNDQNFFSSTPSQSAPSSGNSGGSPVYSPPSISTPVQRSVAPAVNYGSLPAPTYSPSPAVVGSGNEQSSVTKMSFDNWAVEGSNAPTWVTNGVSKANFYSPAPSMLSNNAAPPSPVRSIRGKAPEAARPFTGDWDSVVSTNTPSWVTAGVSKATFYSPAPSNSVTPPPRSSDRQMGLTNADTWNESPNSDMTDSGDMFLTGPFSRMSPAPAPAPAPASPQYCPPRIPTVPGKRFDKDGAYPTASNSYGSLAPFSVPPQSVVQSSYGGSEYGSRRRVQPYGDPASTSGNRPRRDSRDPFAESGDFRPEDPTREFENPRRWNSAPTPVSRESLDGAYPTNSGSYGGSVAPYARSNGPSASPQDFYDRHAYGRPNDFPNGQRPQDVRSSGGFAGDRDDAFRQDGGRSREYQPTRIDPKVDFLSGQSNRPPGYGDSSGRDEFSQSSPYNENQPMREDRKRDHGRAESDRYSSQSSSRSSREGEPRGAGQNDRRERMGWQSEPNGKTSTSPVYRSSEYPNDSHSPRTNQDSRPDSSSGGRIPNRSEGQNSNQGFGRSVSSPEWHAPGGWSTGGQQSSSSSTRDSREHGSSSSRREGSQSSTSDRYQSSASSGSARESREHGSSSSRREGTQTSTSGGYQSGGASDGRDRSSSPGSPSSSRSASSTSSTSSTSSSSSTSSTSSSSTSSTAPPHQPSVPAPSSSSSNSRPKSYSAFGSKPKAPGGNAAFGGSGGYLSGF